jgi:Tol biopolymer transport system component
MGNMVSDGDPQSQQSRAGNTILDAPWVCLRCDWTGRSDTNACPRCEAPLYRRPESTEPPRSAPAPGAHAHAAGDPIPEPSIEEPLPGDDVRPARRVVVSRRWWVIVGAFTVAVVWIVAAWRPLDRLQADEAPSPPPSKAASPAGEVLRRGGEVLKIEGSDLVAVDPDTGESRTLVDRGAVNRADPNAGFTGAIANAAWSPDGKWVAFDGPESALWVMNAEMEIRRLAPLEDPRWVWSPTEAQLTMVIDSTLTLVDPSTAQATDLGELIGDVTSAPVWSPDGTRIVFGARGGSLYAVEVATGERSLLVRLPGEHLDSVDEIEWSPDGAHILVMNDLGAGQAGRLYVMNADGSGVRVLQENYHAGGAAWSPDGDAIAYVKQESVTDDLRTVSPIGGSPSTIAAITSMEAPVWSPDGSRVGVRGWTLTDGEAWYAVDPKSVGRWEEIDELTYLSWREGLLYPGQCTAQLGYQGHCPNG